MKKGIGPRGLGSPLKQTTKPKRKTKTDNVTLSQREQARKDYIDRKQKMKPTEVAKEIIPGFNALVRAGDVANRLKDLSKNTTNKKNK